MKTELDATPIQTVEEDTGLVEMLTKTKELCQYCRPATPIKCVTDCNIWRLRNQLSRLHRRIDNLDFMKDLFNALKNKRRLRIIEILSKGRYTIETLQQKLKETGYHHSQLTIRDEYVGPIVDVGIVQKNGRKYHLTLLGHRLNELTDDLDIIEERLPPHSECYEEKIITTLFERQKTYDELESSIGAESLSRVLSRLRESNLIKEDRNRRYMFYYPTKRDPDKERLSPTEERVYGNIPEEGISARKLAEKTVISLRRTYKYLRRLRGKKLAFKRKNLKKYTLTEEGKRIAKLLLKIRELILQFKKASKRFLAESSQKDQQNSVSDPSLDRDKRSQILVRAKI